MQMETELFRMHTIVRVADNSSITLVLLYYSSTIVHFADNSIVVHVAETVLLYMLQVTLVLYMLQKLYYCTCCR